MSRGYQGKLGVAAWIVFLLALAFLCIFAVDSVRRPGLTRRRNILQKAQFNALNAATELFNNEFDRYPPSDANDRAGQPYCGAMKLAEALMGQDLFGFHSESIFRRDGRGSAGLSLYPPTLDNMPISVRNSNLQARKGPFVLPGNVTVRKLVDVYGKGNTGPFPESTFVLCDVYMQKRPSGKKTGMPILYYRANPSGTTHDVLNPDNPENIYCAKDNQALLALGVPGKPGESHPLANPKRFYSNTENREIPSRPYRADTFILISAGGDGLYGTADDICNFDWKYRQR